ncbi:MAG: 16S rRNA (guanine(527)-N(7))-methyltransferase RsmG [Alphaproteobacteria bacterium RIFCSPHIGHO2_12_FULL_45_9]|nr:MAG: 16S rRNA (guanine(527)-N(7))-methyltransferase RsmG [Alphaproteobacteria bacterium RIFCSPHIGHO2_02_FULL_46_13]OFW98968.1 MAG: 16S rRNA (guanine(527)-N(7))-methyltransferase RsmG [Alphaproteobacteria bacterium RIFCSPHIGHO2_12_FULL_45_9]
MAKQPNTTLSVKLNKYHELLLKWSKVINLVAPSTLPDAKMRHFVDSTQIIPLIPADAKTLFDIGSGAGFPGMVLAIECPNLSVHLIESDTKKCSFLATISRETDTPVLIHNRRIESVDKLDGIKPDVITARALASLGELLALTEQWWSNNPQVTLIFPKGAKANEEIADAQKSYQFHVELVPSQTDKLAQILVLRDIKKL